MERNHQKNKDTLQIIQLENSFFHTIANMSAKYPESDLQNCYFDDYKRKAGYLASARSQFEAYHSL